MTGMLPFPDISPEIFSITLFGMTFALRWYALAYIVGIVLGWRLVVRAVRTPRLWRNETPVMTADQVEDLLFYVIIGVIAGGRLGYGGGFYDRTLELLRAKRPTFAIGFAFSAQEAENLPLEPTDQPLDMLITESRILSFGQN